MATSRPPSASNRSAFIKPASLTVPSDDDGGRSLTRQRAAVARPTSAARRHRRLMDDQVQHAATGEGGAALFVIGAVPRRAGPTEEIDASFAAPSQASARYGTPDHADDDDSVSAPRRRPVSASTPSLNGCYRPVPKLRMHRPHPVFSTTSCSGAFRTVTVPRTSTPVIGNDTFLRLGTGGHCVRRVSPLSNASNAQQTGGQQEVSVEGVVEVNSFPDSNVALSATADREAFVHWATKAVRELHADVLPGDALGSIAVWAEGRLAELRCPPATTGSADAPTSTPVCQSLGHFFVLCETMRCLLPAPFHPVLAALLEGVSASCVFWNRDRHLTRAEKQSPAVFAAALLDVNRLPQFLASKAAPLAVEAADRWRETSCAAEQEKERAVDQVRAHAIARFDVLKRGLGDATHRLARCLLRAWRGYAAHSRTKRSTATRVVDRLAAREHRALLRSGFWAFQANAVQSKVRREFHRCEEVELRAKLREAVLLDEISTLKARVAVMIADHRSALESGEEQRHNEVAGLQASHAADLAAIAKLKEEKASLVSRLGDAKRETSKWMILANVGLREMSAAATKRLGTIVARDIVPPRKHPFQDLLLVSSTQEEGGANRGGPPPPVMFASNFVSLPDVLESHDGGSRLVLLFVNHAVRLRLPLHRPVESFGVDFADGVPVIAMVALVYPHLVPSSLLGADAVSVSDRCDAACALLDGIQLLNIVTPTDIALGVPLKMLALSLSLFRLYCSSFRYGTSVADTACLHPPASMGQALLGSSVRRRSSSKSVKSQSSGSTTGVGVDDADTSETNASEVNRSKSRRTQQAWSDVDAVEWLWPHQLSGRNENAADSDEEPCPSPMSASQVHSRASLLQRGSSGATSVTAASAVSDSEWNVDTLFSAASLTSGSPEVDRIRRAWCHRRGHHAASPQSKQPGNSSSIAPASTESSVEAVVVNTNVEDVHTRLLAAVTEHRAWSLLSEFSTRHVIDKLQHARSYDGTAPGGGSHDVLDDRSRRVMEWFTSVPEESVSSLLASNPANVRNELDKIMSVCYTRYSEIRQVYLSYVAQDTTTGATGGASPWLMSQHMLLQFVRDAGLLKQAPKGLLEEAFIAAITGTSAAFHSSPPSSPAVNASRGTSAFASAAATSGLVFMPTATDKIRRTAPKGMADVRLTPAQFLVVLLHFAHSRYRHSDANDPSSTAGRRQPAAPGPDAAEEGAAAAAADGDGPSPQVVTSANGTPWLPLHLCMKRLLAADVIGGGCNASAVDLIADRARHPLVQRAFKKIAKPVTRILRSLRAKESGLPKSEWLNGGAANTVAEGATDPSTASVGLESFLFLLKELRLIDTKLLTLPDAAAVFHSLAVNDNDTMMAERAVPESVYNAVQGNEPSGGTDTADDSAAASGAPTIGRRLTFNKVWEALTVVASMRLPNPLVPPHVAVANLCKDVAPRLKDVHL